MDTQVVTEGPLAAWSEALSAELVRLGYTRRTAASHMSLVRGLSKWMEQHQVGAADITPGLLEEFFQERTRAGWMVPAHREDAVVVARLPPAAGREHPYDAALSAIQAEGTARSLPGVIWPTREVSRRTPPTTTPERRGNSWQNTVAAASPCWST